MDQGQFYTNDPYSPIWPTRFERINVYAKYPLDPDKIKVQKTESMKEADSYTDAIQDLLTHNFAFVPGIWPLEGANVLLVAERKKRITKSATGHFVEMLSQLPIEVDSIEPERVFHDILSLARQYKLTSYGASYIELAVRKGLPIASLDKAILADSIPAGMRPRIKFPIL